MQTKKKLCAGCNTEQYIWKKEGPNRYCKSCWAKIKGGELKRTPIKKRSSKLQKHDAEYTQLRRLYLLKHPMCQIKIPGCTGTATDIHHMAYRGDKYLDVETWKSACRHCHDWVHSHPKEARELGHLL